MQKHHYEAWKCNILDLSILGINIIMKKLSELFYKYTTPKSYDVSVILVNWGTSSTRKTIIQKVLHEHEKQIKVNIDIIFVELLFDGEDSMLTDYNFNGNHIIIHGNESNKDLFQKEALMNIGGKHAKYDNLLFLDNDIWSDDLLWFYKAVRTVKTKNTVTQPFSIAYDTEDVNLAVCSYTAQELDVRKTKKLPSTPGLAFGMTKKYFTHCEGFPSFHIFGDGDIMFISDVYQSIGKMAKLPIHSFLRKYRRKTGILALPKFVNVKIYHEHHGGRSTRTYQSRYKVMDYMYINGIEYPSAIDDQGLISWNDNINPLREVCSHINDDISSSELYKFIYQAFNKDQL